MMSFRSLAIWGALVAFLFPLFVSWYAGGWVARYYSPPFSFDDIPDLSGKTAIVTGSNVGIGFTTARALARKNCKVVLAARSDERGKAAVQKIQNDLQGLPGAHLVEYMRLDLASFSQVASFVRGFRAKHGKLDILVLNAAVIMNGYEETVNGFESQIGVNHLGHFLLVKLLLPMIRYSKTRVVHVSSASHRDSYKEGIVFDSWKGPNAKALYSRFFAYGQSKLANVLFSNELAVRLNGTGATSNALHPGIIATEGQRHLRDLLKQNVVTSVVLLLFNLLWGASVLSLDDGALTQLYVATSPKLAGVTGKYFIPIGLDRTSDVAPAAKNATLQKLLWTVSEKHTAGF